MSAPKRKTCACCGGDAGRFVQWPNQDAGYGLCRPCVEWIQRRGTHTPEEFERTYGREGVHYEKSNP